MDQVTDIPSLPLPDNEAERSTDAIRRDIERRRESIARTVDQAGQKLQESLNWRERVREQPYVALVATACIGFVFAGLFRRRGSPSAQLSADLAGTVNEIGRSLRHSVRQITQPRHGVARALGAAITTVATQAAVNEVRRRVAPAPDSRQEFQSPKGDTDESGA